jgi:protein-S-isoprenylcysteine O-methyltransferase Ste14
VRPIPPLIAIFYLGAAEGVDRLLPSEPLIERGLTSVIAGCVLLVAGIGLTIWAAQQFNRVDTTKDPYGTPTTLVTSGPFDWTRNPMYIGMTTCLLGVGVMIGAAVFLAVPVAFLLTVNRWFVPNEEAKLAELFGPKFEEYRARVRRWF